MKCFACRQLLGDYLDGDLSNGVKVAVAGHLVSCAACSGLAQELHNADVKLAGLALVEPRADFTQVVMARVAALPVPHARPLVRVWWFAAYVVAAWVGLTAGILARGISWKPVVVGASTFAAKMSIAFDALYRIGQHFHLLSVAALGVGIEITLLIVLAVVGRNYISRLGATLLGARL